MNEKPMNSLGELFPPVEVKQASPRAVWIKTHNLQLQFNRDLPEPWAVWQGQWTAHHWDATGETGATATDALANWARLNQVRLWNESEIDSSQWEPSPNDTSMRDTSGSAGLRTREPAADGSPYV